MLNNMQSRDLLVTQNRQHFEATKLTVSNSLKIKQKRFMQCQNEIIAQQAYENSCKSWQKATSNVQNLPKSFLRALNSRDTMVYIDLSRNKHITQTIENLSTQLMNSRSQNFNLHPQIVSIQEFYLLLQRFIWKLKLEHQTETNFKINLVVLNQISQKDIGMAQGIIEVYKKIIKVCRQLVINMNKKQQSVIQMEEDLTQSEKQQLKSYKSVFTYLLNLFTEDETAQLQQNKFPQTLKFVQLLKFTSNLSRVFDSYYRNQKVLGSSIFSMQPEIGNFTYLVHPVILSIQAYFKSNQDKKKQKLKLKLQERMKSLQNLYIDFDRSEDQQQQPFKAVFVNLDGYESQFNIELANYLGENFMYISFPREQYSTDKSKIIYSERLLKKILKNLQQQTKKSTHQTSTVEKDPTFSSEVNFKYEDKFNYLKIIRQNFNDCKNQNDFKDQQKSQNDRLYVFPLRSNYLLNSNKFRKNLQDALNIQEYQSFLINYVLKDILSWNIMKFRPTVVIVSYSGKLNIDHQHVIEIFQELSIVSSFKLILVPNLTAYFAEHQRNSSQTDKSSFDGFTQTNKMIYKQKITKLYNKNKFELTSQMTPSCNLLNIVAKFLKIGSGTYNLVPLPQAKGINWKKNNQKATCYFNKLLQSMVQNESKQQELIQEQEKEKEFSPKKSQKKSQEKSNLQKMMIPQQLSDQFLQILPLIGLQKQKKITQTFNKPNNSLVPTFYTKLYKKIYQLIFPQEQTMISEKNQLYQVQIRLLKQHLREKLSIRAKFQKQNNLTAEQIMKNQIILFNQYRQRYFFDISNQKVQEKAYVYIRANKQKNSKSEFDVSNVYEITFLERKNQILLGNQVSLLYREDQNNMRKIIKKQYFPILLMNSLANKGEYFKSMLFWIKQSHHKEKDKTKPIRCNMDKQIKINEQEKLAKYGQFAKYVTYTDWSFTETSEFIILFWPSQFDFIRANICQMIGKEYSPEILNDIYVSNKEKIDFRKVDTIMTHQICPRARVSVLQQSNRLYLFGGTYQKSKNYLNLQTDLTEIDLQSLNEHGKVTISNLKNKFYSKQVSQYRVSKKMKQNSFVKPKLQYQFYCIEQIDPNFKQSPGQKIVIMIGGYGQNFLQPHQFYKNHFYMLNFKKKSQMTEHTFQLGSIQKKTVYDKMIPINTNKLIKYVELCTIKKKQEEKASQSKFEIDVKKHKIKSRLHKEQQFTDKLLRQGTEIFMRYKYSFIDNNLEAQKQYMFQEEQFQHYKQPYMDIYEIRRRKVIEITFQLVQTKMTQIRILRNRLQYFVQVFYKPLQMIQFKIFQQFQAPRQNTLSMIQVTNNFLCSLINHPLYTQGKYVLYQISAKDLKGKQFFDNQKILLEKMTILQDSFLGMHFLFSKNQKAIFVVHGQRVIKNSKLKEYIVKVQKDKKAIQKKRQIIAINPRDEFTNQTEISTCCSIFFNIFPAPVLWSFQFCSQQNSDIVELFVQSITAEDTKNCKWKTWGDKKLKYRFKIEKKILHLKNMQISQAYIFAPNNLQRDAKLQDFQDTKLNLQIIVRKQTYQCQIKIEFKEDVTEVYLQEKIDIYEQQFDKSLKIIHKSKQIFEEYGLQDQIK